MILICLYIPKRLMCTPHPFNILLSIFYTADNLKYLKPLKTTPMFIVSKQYYDRVLSLYSNEPGVALSFKYILSSV